MTSTRNQGDVYEVHHTVITVIETATSQDEAEALARRMLENGPVDRWSITQGAEVFRVKIATSSVDDTEFDIPKMSSLLHNGADRGRR